MVQSAAHTPRVDLGLAILPSDRVDYPSVVRTVEQDAAIQDRLVRSAYDRLGSPGTQPLDGWRELERSTRIRQALSSDGALDPALGPLLKRNDWALRLDLGSHVDLPGRPYDPRTWTVVGVGPSDSVHLQRSVGSAPQHQTVRWPALITANPHLAKDWLSWDATPRFLRVEEALPSPLLTSTSALDEFDALRALTAPSERCLLYTSPSPRDS